MKQKYLFCIFTFLLSLNANNISAQTSNNIQSLADDIYKTERPYNFTIEEVNNAQATTNYNNSFTASTIGNGAITITLNKEQQKIKNEIDRISEILPEKRTAKELAFLIDVSDDQTLPPELLASAKYYAEQHNTNSTTSSQTNSDLYTPVTYSTKSNPVNKDTFTSQNITASNTPETNNKIETGNNVQPTNVVQETSENNLKLNQCYVLANKIISKNNTIDGITEEYYKTNFVDINNKITNLKQENDALKQKILNSKTKYQQTKKTTDIVEGIGVGTAIAGGVGAATFGIASIINSGKMITGYFGEGFNVNCTISSFEKDPAPLCVKKCMYVDDDNNALEINENNMLTIAKFKILAPNSKIDNKKIVNKASEKIE